jgi:drug/metabolite transporter (DMT)-like permease
MYAGYIFMLLGLVSFAAMGIFHKLADVFQCDPLRLTLLTMGFAAVIATGNAFLFDLSAPADVPVKVILIAVPFGVATSAAFWFFQRGLRFGKIATSWLIINLSSGMSTVLSIVIYREPVNWRKATVLLLVLVSIILLWWDRSQSKELSGVAVEGD